MTHTTASSVGGFLSSLPPSNRAGSWNAFSAWLIYGSSSLHCKAGKLLWLTSKARWSLSSFCKELAGRRMLGVRRNRKAHSSPTFLGGFQKKKPSLYFFFFSPCFEIIKPHKKTFQWNWTLAKPQSSSQWGMVRTDFWGRKKRPPEQKYVLQSVSRTCASIYQKQSSPAQHFPENCYKKGIIKN